MLARVAFQNVLQRFFWNDAPLFLLHPYSQHTGPAGTHGTTLVQRTSAPAHRVLKSDSAASRWARGSFFGSAVRLAATN